MKLTNIRPLSPSKLKDTRRWLGQIVKTHGLAIIRDDVATNLSDNGPPLQSHIVVRELMRGK